MLFHYLFVLCVVYQCKTFYVFFVSPYNFDKLVCITSTSSMVISTNLLLILLLREHTFTFYFEICFCIYQHTERVKPLNIFPMSYCMNHYHSHVFLKSFNQKFISSFSRVLFCHTFFDDKIYNSLNKVMHRLTMYT